MITYQKVQLRNRSKNHRLKLGLVSNKLSKISSILMRDLLKGSSNRWTQEKKKVKVMWKARSTCSQKMLKSWSKALVSEFDDD